MVLVIAVLGAGPHGRQIAHDITTALRTEAAVLYDDHLDGYPPCGDAAGLPWIAGAVWPAVRRGLVQRHHTLTDPWNNGVYISPAATIGIETSIGRHVHVLASATVSHGCVLADYVTVCTGAILCGDIEVGAGAVIGAGAIIRHGGIHIGAGATVPMGAVITKDVEPGMVAR